MVTREALYELVWSKPMTKVAEEFAVTGTYLARVCTVLRVPRPGRGYWAKLAVGKAPAKELLPAHRPGDQVSWSRDGGLGPLPAPEPPRPRRNKRRAESVAGIHSLIRGAKGHFGSGRPVEEGAYLRPFKKLLVDITATKACLDKALAFANDLFNAFETAGHRVVLAPPDDHLRRAEVDERETPRSRPHYSYIRHWSPQRPTVVYIGTVAFGLAVVETSEEVLMRYLRGKYIRDADYVPPKRGYVDHTWTTTQELPTERLRLLAYSPYHRVSWANSWQETPSNPLTGKIPAIIKALEQEAAALADKLKEAQRQAEIAHQKWLEEQQRRREEEDRRRVRQSITDSQAQLAEIIRNWGEVMTVERFLQGVASRAAMLSADQCQAVLERLALARGFLGTQDPLDFFLSWRTPEERYIPLFGKIGRCEPG